MGLFYFLFPIQNNFKFGIFFGIHFHITGNIIELVMYLDFCFFEIGAKVVLQIGWNIP